MSYVNKEIALFILLTLVVLINPNWSTKLYSTILGRLVLVAILTYFATYNTTLALMVSLILIIGFNNYYTNVMYGIEGFTNGEKDKEKKDKKDKKEEVGMELANNDGPLDFTHLEQNIRAKESSSIDAKPTQVDEVDPTSVENFQSHEENADW